MNRLRSLIYRHIPPCSILEIYHDYAMARLKRLVDEYSFPGFVPQARVKGKVGDPAVRIIVLKRRSKKERRAAVAAQFTTASMTARLGLCATFHMATAGCVWRWSCGGCPAANAGR